MTHFQWNLGLLGAAVTSLVVLILGYALGAFNPILQALTTFAEAVLVLGFVHLGDWFLGLVDDAQVSPGTLNTYNNKDEAR